MGLLVVDLIVVDVTSVVVDDAVEVNDEEGICEVGLGKVDSTTVVDSDSGVLRVSVLADVVNVVAEVSTG